MDQKRPASHSLARLALVALLCLVLCGGFAQAYELILKAPSQMQRGMPLVVNGTSNLPPGISVDIVLYKSGHVTEELARKTVTLQANSEFSVVFDTTGYTKGVYKVEVPAISGYSYLGDSVTLRVIEIIDRSDEIVFSAFSSQEMDGTLDIDGSIAGLENSGSRSESPVRKVNRCSDLRILPSNQTARSPHRSPSRTLDDTTSALPMQKDISGP
jgi:hypothetical protein